MHFSADANNITTGMNLVSHALAARNANPKLNGVLMETTDDGLVFTCTDGEFMIRTEIPATVVEDGVTVLPAKLFGELIHFLNGEVDIDVDSEHHARICSHGSNTQMMGMDAADYPEWPEMKPVFEVNIPQNSFRNAISHVLFAIASDENSHRILTGCLMEVSANEVRFVGLDGFRLSLQCVACENTIPEGKEYVAVVIPGKLIGEISRMMEDSEENVNIQCGNNRVLFRFGSTVCSTSILSGEYINYRQILPMSWQSEVRIVRTAFTNAIERAALMAREGKNNLVRLQINATEMTISSASEMGSSKETVPVEYTGQEFKIAFNSRYLMDVMRNVDTDEIRLCFNTSVSPCTVSPIDGNAYRYLILPVRVM